MTRSGIASAARAEARHAYTPAARHWKAARKIVTYLKATKDMRAVFRRGEDWKLLLSVDVNNADRCNDRRSVLGVAVMLGNTDLSAHSTTQYCVTLSTTKAKYVAMVHEAKKVLE